MNLGEAKNKVLMLINQYSTRGTVNNDGNIADYNLKLKSFLDLAQSNIAETKYIKRSYIVSQYLPFVPSEEQFEIKQHIDSDITVSGTGYAYFFSVDNDADVYIEEVYSDGTVVELDFINAYSEEGFTDFKGLIEPLSTTSTVQIRFSGDYAYNIKNAVIYPAKYRSYDKVPDFSRYISYQMPDDYLLSLNVSLKTKSDYIPLTDFVWENPHTIGISAYTRGEIRIEYAASPTTITDTAADTYEFEIGLNEQGAMVYYAAALCMQHINPNVYSTLMQLYTEKMLNVQENKGLRQTAVKKVFNV